jgi:hypothetical protein
MEEILTRAIKSSGQEQQARPSSSAARLKPDRTLEGVLEGFVERLFLAPTLVASAIVLMRLSFRIGNHFRSLPVPLAIFKDMTQISVP